jgi:hypothetical protein
LAIDVTIEEVERYANRVLVDLTAKEKMRPATAKMTDALANHIKKRVAPGALQKHMSVLGAVHLMSLDIESLGMRISRYRHLGEYRKHFTSPSPEIGMSFASHLYDLRPNELYTILERGTETL